MFGQRYPRNYRVLYSPTNATIAFATHKIHHHIAKEEAWVRANAFIDVHKQRHEDQVKMARIEYKKERADAMAVWEHKEWSKILHSYRKDVVNKSNQGVCELFKRVCDVQHKQLQHACGNLMPDLKKRINSDLMTYLKECKQKLRERVSRADDVMKALINNRE